MFQVNVWALHDPYAVLREDKPLKPGEAHLYLMSLPAPCVNKQDIHESQTTSGCGLSGLRRSWSLISAVLDVSGKCYRVPDGLDDGGKRKRKRAASLQDFRSWFRGTCENRPSLEC